MITLGVALLPISLALLVLGPGAVAETVRGGAASGPSELRLAAMDIIALCLVDPRQGETLWFDLEPVGTGDLRDASLVDRLIGTAYWTFTEAMHP